MRRPKRITRCVRCRLHPTGCICDVIRQAAARIREQVRTRVVVVMQAKEARRCSNTGHLVAEMVAGAEVRRWGDRHRSDPLDDLGAQGATYLLFPDPGATLVHPHLHDLSDGAALTLVVPDGSWRQANRMAHRDPVLARLPRLALPAGGPARWKLRASPRADGLCTLEAVGRALGELDALEIRTAVEAVLAAQVRSTMRARGRPVDRAPRDP